MAKINLKVFPQFLNSSNAGGILLFSAVVLSLIVANTGLADGLNHWLHTYIGIENKSVKLNLSILHWINDGLMAIFFLLVGLEIKRELVEGELSSPKQALFPILAAFCGAIVPALIYFLLNKGETSASGWGIPMATDIAFALAVISTLDKRIPASLKIFLAALAIVDDLIAILVIALFYSSGLQTTYLSLAGLCFIILILMNRFKINNYLYYLLPGIFMWYFVLHSGIHATIAGVLLALTIPTNATDEASPLEKLEHQLLKPVNLLIVPLFAFANTNISFQKEMLEGLTSPLGLGIILGLMLGKPLGISIIAFISSKFKIASLPTNSNWMHIIGVGFLAGIGFTMSIFIALLSFKDAILIAEAKLAVLIASLLSGIMGYIILKYAKK
ncbi:MAG: Na+/H+ antiporter NhaA [Chitinophagaceae bacterium]|nr:MAG: Na+/H+ antiporter NhaA [Chitinophagaceae bacterium]